MLKFELAGKEEEVDIGGEIYKVKELSCLDIAKWKDIHAKKMKTNSQGMATGLKSFEGIESSLVTLCLFDSKNNNVPAKIIDSWFNSTVTALFKLCITMNGLGDDEAETQKN